MKTQVSSTSIETYYSHIKGVKEDTENERVLQAIRKLKVATGRMIGNLLEHKIENSAIARCLNNLKKENKVIVWYKSQCPVTGKPAQFYKVTENQLTIF